VNWQWTVMDVAPATVVTGGPSRCLLEARTVLWDNRSATLAAVRSLSDRHAEMFLVLQLMKRDFHKVQSEIGREFDFVRRII